MSEYQSLLASCKMESEHPYNDGWSQLHYKKQYEELLNLGEKEFTKNMLDRKIQSLEDRISKLTIELNEVKSKLSDIN
ncbi:MAG: hypothetical protein EB127_21590 [Alphaproteobacteria bacterium]|nr:hypothetical protein [Alphaproteobacteria bacterium]